MKVLLMKDVYNLGRAGDVKKVANGYGRNFLIPQGYATLATPGAMKNADRIRAKADKQRSLLNEELSSVADDLTGIQLQFPAKAGETGKLYGSVTTQMIANEISEKIGREINRRQIDSQPLRLLGMHNIKVRLTLDLIPDVSVVVFREGEPIENYMVAAEELTAEFQEQFEEAQVELEEAAAEEAEAEDDVEGEASAEEPSEFEPTDVESVDDEEAS